MSVLESSQSIVGASWADNGNQNGFLSVVLPEILAHISDLLTPWDIGRLWFCGNKMLCRSLKMGGVRKFDVQIGPNQPISFFPSLVSEFAFLDTFRLSIDAHSKSAPDMDLRKLPTSLRALSLRGFRLREDLVETDLLRHFTALSVLKLPYHRACDEVMLLALPSSLVELRIPLADKSLDLEALPTPHLTRLSIWVQKSPLLGLNFTQLESLTDLKVDGKELRFSGFPSGLTSFRTTCHVQPQDMRHLPSTLSKFSAVAPTLANWSQYQWPQNLETLSLHTRILEPVRPPSEGFTAELFGLIPRTVTKLVISYLIALPLEILNFLPPSLRYLECGFRQRRDTEVQDSFQLPAGLTYLTVHRGPYDLAPLPPALKVLSVPSFSLEASQWPPSLTQFSGTIAGATNAQFESHPFPSTLRDLALTLQGNVSLLCLLPTKQLQSLHLNLLTASETLASGWSAFLPPTLTSLALIVPGKCLDDAWLEKLHLPALKHFECELEPVLFSVNAAFSGRLPRALTRLDLAFADPIDWSVLDLRSHLPELRILQLASYKIKNLKSEIIPLLPRRLISLRVTAQPSSFQPNMATVISEFKDAHINLASFQR
jgi:hypothetical protein